MEQNNQYFVIIDFEATCTNDKEFPSNEMEIIEFSGIVINRKFSIIKEFFYFIKPVRHPILTAFCTQLTTITQQDVDESLTFPEVLKLFSEQIIPYNPIFISWGNWDKYILRENCDYYKLPYPFEITNHINIKKKIAIYLGFRKEKGISNVLKYLKMEFIGTQHRGIDDVRNIIRILIAINYPLKDLKIKKA